MMIMGLMEISFFHIQPQAICRIRLHIATLLAFINSDRAFHRIELVKKIYYIRKPHACQLVLDWTSLKDLDRYVVSNNKENGCLCAKSQYQTATTSTTNPKHHQDRGIFVCDLCPLPSLLTNYVQLLPFTTIAD
jgi:hypothetical protein